MNTEVVKQFVGALVRNLLQLAFGWLTLKGWLTPEQSQGFDLGAMALGIAGFIVVLGWSIYQKLRARIETKVALKMPPSTSESTLKDQASLEPISAALKPINK